MSISGTITYEASGFKLVGDWDGRLRIEWADPKPSDDVRRQVDDAVAVRLTRGQMVTMTENGMAELAMLVREVLAAPRDGESVDAWDEYEKLCEAAKEAATRKGGGS